MAVATSARNVSIPASLALILLHCSSLIDDLGNQSGTESTDLNAMNAMMNDAENGGAQSCVDLDSLHNHIGTYAAKCQNCDLELAVYECM
jgi:hypothetical protein